MNTVIKVENLSKQYRLGKIGTGTISHDLNRWWHTVRGKEDPYLKIGAVNDRTQKSNDEYVWALRDINFEVKQGEVLGIIGRNGAGKSTLLKILSKTTAPTTGSIKIDGRIASLLEVGTGFHPELSGRENIFLNGSIMGMRKAEIQKKFDEIVDFSGVERYIDTPVKRYSSGMYVRLAFAVAAHLEPEILIVDEVLSVGDAEFQKKCLGKMGDVSKGEGRTVLFVSHNMAAINTLCNRSVLLRNGNLIVDGPTEDVIVEYMRQYVDSGVVANREIALDKNADFQILSAKITDNKKSLIERSINVDEEYFIEIDYFFKRRVPQTHLVINILNSMGEIVYLFDRRDYSNEYFDATPGKYRCRVKFPNPLLKPGVYYINLGFADQEHKITAHQESILSFEIKNLNSIRSDRPGTLYLPLEWKMEKYE